MNLSVVMPVYNERVTLRQSVERVRTVPLEIELLCVDDGSRDGWREILTDSDQSMCRFECFCSHTTKEKERLSAAQVPQRQITSLFWPVSAASRPFCSKEV